MAKFDRYIDGDNRLFIVLHEWCKVDIDKGEIVKITKTQVELLDVNAQKANELPAADFQRYVDKGLLKLLENTIKNPK